MESASGGGLNFIVIGPNKGQCVMFLLLVIVRIATCLLFLGELEQRGRNGILSLLGVLLRQIMVARTGLDNTKQFLLLSCLLLLHCVYLLPEKVIVLFNLVNHVEGVPLLTLHVADHHLELLPLLAFVLGEVFILEQLRLNCKGR